MFAAQWRRLLPCVYWLAAAAGADEIPPAAESGSDQKPTLPVIIISPEWQPVDAQTSAKTVHHFSGEELSSAAVHDTLDLQYLTPGLVFKTDSVLGQPYLRGVGSDLISAGAESSVATLMDGVYLPRAYNSVVTLFDVDRVEVLKGPQGVHLGRNVTAGAISIHTRDPEPYRSSALDLSAGDYAMRQVRGMVNTPFAEQKVSVRLTGSFTQRDGFTDNVYLGKDKDDADRYGLRGKVLYAPSSAFSLLLVAEHSREDSSRALAPHPDPSPASGGVALGGVVPEDPRRVTANVDAAAETETDRYSVRLKWQWDDISLTSQSAFIDSNARLALDLDNTNVDFSANFPSGDSTTVTQEFRLSSNPEARRLAWTTGVFLLRERAKQRLDVRLPLFGITNVPDSHVDTRAYGAFGQIVYRFTDAWRGKAGVRHSYDERQLDLVQTLTDPLGIVGPAGVTVLRQNESTDWQATTPELGVEYTPGKDRLYYLTASRGYKAGGYNTSSVQPAFDPEYLRAFEAGVKASFPRRGLRANAALFHYDYNDMQLDTLPASAPAGAYPVVINAAQATIQGGDIELLFRPIGNLDVSLGATVLFTAEFDEFVAVDPNNPTSDPDRSGDRLPQSPALSLNLGLDYTRPVDGGQLVFSTRYRYQSKVYYNLYQDSTVSQDGYSLIDAGISFKPYRGAWYAELYGRNLSDKLYAQNVIRGEPLWGTLRFWGAPRTVGVRVGYHW